MSRWLARDRERRTRSNPLKGFEGVSERYPADVTMKWRKGVWVRFMWAEENFGMQDVLIQMWDDHFMLSRDVPGYQIDTMTLESVEAVLSTMYQTLLAVDESPERRG